MTSITNNLVRIQIENDAPQIIEKILNGQIDAIDTFMSVRSSTMLEALETSAKENENPFAALALGKYYSNIFSVDGADTLQNRNFVRAAGFLDLAVQAQNPRVNREVFEHINSISTHFGSFGSTEPRLAFNAYAENRDRGQIVSDMIGAGELLQLRGRLYARGFDKNDVSNKIEAEI